MAEEGSELERGLHAIVGSFYRYAKGPPGAKVLDQEAFQTLLSNELSHQLTVRPGYWLPKATGDINHWLLVKNPEEQKAALDMFKTVDANNDQKISFDEYWDLIVEICQVIRRRHYNE